MAFWTISGKGRITGGPIGHRWYPKPSIRDAHVDIWDRKSFVKSMFGVGELRHGQNSVSGVQKYEERDNLVHFFRDKSKGQNNILVSEKY